MHRTYEERKAKRYVFSFAGDDEPILNTYIGEKEYSMEGRESDMDVDRITIRNLPQNDAFLFSIVERDDKKGFGVFMHGIKVAKNTAVVVENCPKWLRWVLVKCCKAW